jgi:hypothetical protein
MLWKIVGLTLLYLVLLATQPALLWAQDAQPVVVQPSRNYLLDILLVVALFGGALFLICKSSRRT